MTATYIAILLKQDYKDEFIANCFLPIHILHHQQFSINFRQIKAQLMAQGTPPPGPQPATIVPFGAYKLSNEWYWLDGSKMSDGANNWQAGEPNGTAEVPENCAGFDPVNGDIGYGDMQCSLRFAFVCQMDPGETG